MESVQYSVYHLVCTAEGCTEIQGPLVQFKGLPSTLGDFAKIAFGFTRHLSTGCINCGNTTFDDLDYATVEIGSSGMKHLVLVFYCSKKTACRNIGVNLVRQVTDQALASRQSSREYRRCHHCGEAFHPREADFCARCWDMTWCSDACRAKNEADHQKFCFPREKPAPREKTCTTCGATLTDETRRHCSRCKVVYYCSRACQKADWGRHKSSCESSSCH